MEKDIKRIIAFSTVSQLAFIFLGFAAGSRLAFAGSMLFILMHSAAKAGLFLSAGIIEHETHTKDITKMGGLAKVIPITFAAFILCMMSIIGIPPLGGFFSKFLVITGTADAGYPVTAAVFVLAATLTILYMLRVFYKVFLAEPAGTFSAHKSGIWSPMNLSITLLAAISLLCGFTFSWLTRFAELAASQIFGIAK
jgi:formate hydrogenlyase subunit 3/multisubunit Na+/H+ antiporter MnhD subunit